MGNGYVYIQLQKSREKDSEHTLSLLLPFWVHELHSPLWRMKNPVLSTLPDS